MAAWGRDTIGGQAYQLKISDDFLPTPGACAPLAAREAGALQFVCVHSSLSVQLLKDPFALSRLETQLILATARRMAA
jgi:hypothetical protein